MNSFDDVLSEMRRTHLTGARNLNDVIKAWCTFFDWPHASIRHVPDKPIGDYLGSLAFYCRRDGLRHKCRTTTQQNWQKGMEKLIETRRSEGDMETTATHWLVLGLVLAAAGYAVYTLNRKRESPQPVTYTPPATNVVVLVISANRVPNQITADELYRATQALWYGRKNSFQATDLSRYFLPGQAVGSEASDHDVYLWKYETSQTLQGFEKGADQIDRMDAFRDLLKLNLEPKKTNRLTKDAYGTTEVYAV